MPQSASRTFLPIGHQQVLRLRVRLNLGVMAIKGYSTLLRAPYWSLTIRLGFISYPGYSLGGECLTLYTVRLF